MCRLPPSSFTRWQNGLGSPQDLSPSFQQWEALVKVCSSVFSQSTLGLRIHQLLKLGGYVRTNGAEGVGHPQDMAEVLLAVGRVASGSLKEISIRGGSGCSWIAAFADQVLGLKVAVRSDEGTMLWTNLMGPLTKDRLDSNFASMSPRRQSVVLAGSSMSVMDLNLSGDVSWGSGTLNSNPACHFRVGEFNGTPCSLGLSEGTLRI